MIEDAKQRLKSEPFRFYPVESNLVGKKVKDTEEGLKAAHMIARPKRPANNVTDSGVQWERSEFPHPKFHAHMRLQLLPDVIWLRFHGIEVTGWQKVKPKGAK